MTKLKKSGSKDYEYDEFSNEAGGIWNVKQVEVDVNRSFICGEVHSDS